MTMFRMRVLTVGVLMLFLVVATNVQAGTGPGLDRLNGRWKLDWSRSDRFDPVMEALEVPWLLRRLAGVVSVHVTFAIEPPECEGCGERLQIVSENPIKNTTRVVVLDGVARPATDPLGNESMDLFHWTDEQGLEMLRERVLKSGKAARIQEHRKVGEDYDTMVSTMTVWIEGEERASVRRVLVRDTE
jgi:hypothetical protein